MKWRTRDGRNLEISEMGTSHISNCIGLLRKTIYGVPVPMLGGEIAQEQAEKGYDEIMETLNNLISNFEKELRKRSK